jgi:LppP/LprE lipoprotein
VRTRSRSHNPRVALLLLGLLATLVALSGGAQDDGAEAAGAAPVGDPVRHVDFSSLAQPGSACTDGLRIAPPRRISVDEGESRLLDLGRLTRLQVDDTVVYGDLDGDGSDEAVVHAVCSYGANGSQDTIQVWSVDEDDDPVLVDSLSEPPVRVTGPLPPAVKDVAVHDGELVVTWTHYRDDDPNCCPSQQTALRYQLDDDALDQVGRPVTSDAD